MPLALVDLPLILLSYMIWYLPFFHTGRGGRRATGRLRWLFPLCVGAVQCLLSLLMGRLLGDSVQALSLTKAAGFYLFLWWPFVAYPGQVPQNLFLLGITGLLSTVVSDFGNVIELALLGSRPLWQLRLLHFLADAGVCAALLPAFLFALRRLMRGWQASPSVPLWRILWLIPGALFLLALSAGNVFSPERIFSAGFIVTRLIIALTMFIVVYTFSGVLAQSAEAAMYRERNRLTEQQLQLQREQYARLTGQILQGQTAREEVRGQFARLRDQARAGDLSSIREYLRESLITLPGESERRLCLNYAVNAVARHYLSLAEAEGIRTDIQLDIPETPGCIQDYDLCIIVGNCMENAIEASLRIPREERFLRMRTRRHQGYLVLVLDNAFDGALPEEMEGGYASRKHAGEGIGIPSVRAVAARYRGACEFRGEGRTFSASVVLGYEPEAVGEGVSAP